MSLGIKADLPQLPDFLQIVWQEYCQAKRILGKVTIATMLQASAIMPLPCLETMQLFIMIENILNEEDNEYIES